MNNKKTISIKIASDVVCPWCYIGKKEIENAMNQLKDEFHFDVQYLPFELSPDMPDEGADFREHIGGKFGDWNRFLEGTKFLVERGKTVGINFDFEGTERSPNTFKMHQIIQLAHQFGIQPQIKNAFMKANFEDNIDLTKTENILKIATDNGLDIDVVKTALSNKDAEHAVRNMEENLRSMGVTGVPFFILENQYGISGAVPASQLVEAIKDVALKQA